MIPRRIIKNLSPFTKYLSATIKYCGSISSTADKYNLKSRIFLGSAPVQAKQISRTMCTCTNKPLKDIPTVDIDPTGVFKYILLKVYTVEKDTPEGSVTIVRGYKRSPYHSDIYDEVQEKLKPLDCEPLGGGRISHDPDAQKIHIYGYSQGYGKADHELAAKLIKETFPNYTITISDEGY